jgi:TldD protein
MLERLENVLGGLKSEYADLRYEENRSVNISYSDYDLRSLSTPRSNGGHLRVYQNGGKSALSFFDIAGLESTADKIRENAEIVGRKRNSKIHLAETEVIKDTFFLAPKKHPHDITISEKKELLMHYRDLVLAIDKVKSVEANYNEFYSKRFFLSTEGSKVEYELLISNIYFLIQAQHDDVIQTTRWSIGGSDDFSKLLNRDESCQNMAERASELTMAKPLPPGIFPVVLDPSEAGVFIHEAFGHLSEADGVQDNPDFLKKLQLGTELAKSILNVSDDGTIKDLPGSHIIDDEGVKTRKTELIKNGILSGRMHSRETAAQFNEPLSGNVRAVGPEHPPIVRMSNIYIEPGKSSFDQMIGSIDHGYYLCGAKGGQTSGDAFTFGAQYGYEISNGKLGHMVRDINMSGTLFETLQNISMVGNDLQFSEIGGCGKGSPMQLNRKSGKGSPHIKIDNVTLGGKS